MAPRRRGGRRGAILRAWAMPVGVRTRTEICTTRLCNTTCQSRGLMASESLQSLDGRGVVTRPAGGT